MKNLIGILVFCAFLFGTATVSRATAGGSLGVAGALFGLKVISDANKTEKKDVKAVQKEKKTEKKVEKKGVPKKK